MSDASRFGLNGPMDEGRRAPAPEVPQPRAVGSPLPIGSSLPSTPPASSLRSNPVSPPGRALVNSSTDSSQDMTSGFDRAVSALRSLLPFVQRILPLLDGNFATAISNLMTSHHQTPPPPPPVDLAPLEDGLAELQTQHRELRNQLVEHNSSLKRVEDQLEMVREATDRNTLEQQELLEDLKVIGNKVNIFALIAIGLLAVSILINIVLYLHIQRVLP